jgi:formylglycine-generating enzyme required for sulfatase activity
MLIAGENNNKMIRYLGSWILAGLILSGVGLSAQEDMSLIPAGSYTPFIKGITEEVEVEGFLLDKYAVTNADFLEFVKANPDWAPENVKSLFADSGYLTHWPVNYLNDKDLESNMEPVVNVSWFAANAYCKWKGKRLPTLHEWEYAALALPKNDSDSAALTRINSDWYSRKTAVHAKVGSTYENQYGVWDMYGLVWEWVDNFNTVISSEDSRNNEDAPQGLFCGSASLNASDASDYVAFIRFAYRGSLKANYTTRKMGFRCAKTIK